MTQLNLSADEVLTTTRAVRKRWYIPDEDLAVLNRNLVVKIKVIGEYGGLS
jgi:hypothetical protein